jgi:hypothetical protein
VSAQLEADDVVRVVAVKLANGAPHPMRGRAGVVLEVRDVGRFPVRVLVDGRPVMFSADELEHVDRVNIVARGKITQARP